MLHPSSGFSCLPSNHHVYSVKAIQDVQNYVTTTMPTSKITKLCEQEGISHAQNNMTHRHSESTHGKCKPHSKHRVDKTACAKINMTSNPNTPSPQEQPKKQQHNNPNPAAYHQTNSFYSVSAAQHAKFSVTATMCKQKIRKLCVPAGISHARKSDDTDTIRIQKQPYASRCKNVELTKPDASPNAITLP